MKRRSPTQTCGRADGDTDTDTDTDIDTDSETLTAGGEGSRHSPNIRVTDEVDSSPVKNQVPPQSDIRRRPLCSTQGQKDDVTLSSKANTKLVPSVLPHTEPSPKKGERNKRFVQEAQPSLCHYLKRGDQPRFNKERRETLVDGSPGSADTSNKNVVFILMFAVVVFSVLFLLLMNKPKAVSLVERTALTIFLDKFEQVEALFYGQQSALWKRSRITLRNHINLTQHEKPAILIFAAAWDGQQTMRCLTRQIADAYSTALNATAMVEVNATVTSGRDSDVVKLEVDTQLSSGFDKGSKVAVIHHFQDLPPLSTLIFYKYCDHENAAYKAVALLITVLLDEEKLAPDVSLKVLEMKVRDFLRRRFSASEGSQGMDTDKLSGLWSRIAHVVLPVAPVREIEEGGCDSKED
ncbi:torsin-1A-interacting protein 2-like isoform X1 [Pristis pectinata]|uniref:torsin-1A-interacting protein 2-like isoform X1 n=1 Tax=Pristis pectinata TaxID=685728 RepID=UPI00223D9E3E|nr:torsin-1A-interacting protein 2-like isoform X1 [Pristis pectinata]